MDSTLQSCSSVGKKDVHSTENISTKLNTVKSTEKEALAVNPIQTTEKPEISNTSSLDDILESTAFIRSPEGIKLTLGHKNSITENLEIDNNDKANKDNTINEDLDSTDNGGYNSEALSNNVIAKESPQINTVAPENYNDIVFNNKIDIIWEKTNSIEHIASERLEKLISAIENSSSIKNIWSEILDKIEKLINAILNGDILYDNISDVLYQIGLLYWALLILFMIREGILSFIKELLVHAQINFLSKASNTINNIKLTKVIAYYINTRKTLANTMLEISNKFLQLKEFIDLLKCFKKRSKKISLKPNNIGYLRTIVNMMRVPGAPTMRNKVSPVFNYKNAPFGPHTTTKELYYKIWRIWDNINKLYEKYQTTHICYDALLSFLANHSQKPRTKAEKDIREYRLDSNLLNPSDQRTFDDYLNDGNIEINNQNNKVVLKSLARDFRVNESEIMGMMLDLLIFFFNRTPEQQDIWRIRQQPKETISNREPDFYIQCLKNKDYYTKIYVECKTFGADNFNSMLRQIHEPGLFLLGDEGHYEEEFDPHTKELKLTGSSQFVILVRGTRIAFLERYNYSFMNTNVNAHNGIIPLTVPVDTTYSIENPRLAAIMDKYRHLCFEDTEFPFCTGNNVTGKYYVFDLIAHPEACQALFIYIISELPRIHIMNEYYK